MGMVTKNRFYDVVNAVIYPLFPVPQPRPENPRHFRTEKSLGAQEPNCAFSRVISAAKALIFFFLLQDDSIPIPS